MLLLSHLPDCKNNDTRIYVQRQIRENMSCITYMCYMGRPCIVCINTGTADTIHISAVPVSQITNTSVNRFTSNNILYIAN